MNHSPTSVHRRPSFVGMVRRANMHNGPRTAEDASRERRWEHVSVDVHTLEDDYEQLVVISPTTPLPPHLSKSISVPGRLPMFKALREREECTPTEMLSSNQGPRGTAVMAEEGSDAVDSNLDEELPAIAGGSDKAPDEVAYLHDLVSTQKADLESAALIGQGLLDTIDELSAKLEEAREERWLANCEKEALRRDLEHAAQRCEQMQRETAIEVHEAGQVQVKDFNTWSSAKSSPGRGSASDDGWASPAVTSTTGVTDDFREEQEREVGRLRKEVESLERVNSALREELVETRLEMTALKRTSVEHGEALLAWETGELGADAGKRASSGPMDARVEAILWEGDGDGSDDDGDGAGDEADVGGQGGVDASDRRPGLISGGTKIRLPAPVSGAASGGYVNRAQGEDLAAGQRSATEETIANNQDRTEVFGMNDDSSTRKDTLVATTAPSSSLQRELSSAFRDAEEQADLIEALRNEISQLRLGVQLHGLARTSMTEVRHRRRRCSSHTALHHDGDAGQSRRRSRCSSDDESVSDRDDSNEEGTDRACGHYPPYRESKPRPFCPKHVCGVEALDEGDGAQWKCKGGGGIDLGRDGGGGVNDRPSRSLLQARVNELSIKLETANNTCAVLRERSRQIQAANLELQRELLRLQSTRDKRAVVVPTAGAHASDDAALPVVAPFRGVDGDNDEGSVQRDDCPTYHGLGWLQWLWRAVFRRSGKREGVESEVEDGFHREAMAMENGFGVGGDGEPANDDVGGGRVPRRLSPNERETLLNEGARRIVGNSSARRDRRGSMENFKLCTHAHY